jgi:hypothetical protein
VLVDAHHQDHRRSVDVGQQAGCALRQRRRVQRRTSIGQVHGHATVPCLGVERVARLHEPSDVGDRVTQHDVVAVRLDRERLIEIPRTGRVDRRELDLGTVDVLSADVWSAGRAFDGLLRGRVDLGRETLRDLELGPDPVESGGHRRRGVFVEPHQRVARRAPMNIPFSAS